MPPYLFSCFPCCYFFNTDFFLRPAVRTDPIERLRLLVSQLLCQLRDPPPKLHAHTLTPRNRPQSHIPTTTPTTIPRANTYPHRGSQLRLQHLRNNNTVQATNQTSNKYRPANNMQNVLCHETTADYQYYPRPPQSRAALGDKYGPPTITGQSL